MCSHRRPVVSFITLMLATAGRPHYEAALPQAARIPMTAIFVFAAGPYAFVASDTRRGEAHASKAVTFTASKTQKWSPAS